MLAGAACTAKASLSCTESFWGVLDLFVSCTPWPGCCQLREMLPAWRGQLHPAAGPWQAVLQGENAIVSCKVPQHGGDIQGKERIVRGVATSSPLC